MEKVDKSGHKKKQSMLEALKKSLGVVTTALIKADVPHSAYYKWINTDPEFAEQVKNVDNIALDFAESKMFQGIEGGNTQLIKFYLSRKGKNRGYVERQEFAGVEGQPTSFQIEIIDSISKD